MEGWWGWKWEDLLGIESRGNEYNTEYHQKNCVEALAEVWKHTISDTMNERACVLMDYLRKETLGVLSTPFKLEIP